MIKKDQLAERLRVQAGSADQGSVYIGHLHEGLDVVRFYTSPVKDANRTGQRFSKQRCEQGPDKMMGLLGLFPAGGFSGSDGPDRLVRDNEAFEIPKSKVF